MFAHAKRLKAANKWYIKERKRVQRGLYRTKYGYTLNADINGAANIIRKYKPDTDFGVLNTSILLNPNRVHVLNTPRKKPTSVKKSKAAA